MIELRKTHMASLSEIIMLDRGKDTIHIETELIIY